MRCAQRTMGALARIARAGYGDVTDEVDSTWWRNKAGRLQGRLMSTPYVATVDSEIEQLWPVMVVCLAKLYQIAERGGEIDQ
jgi:hypothetical protein